MELSQLLLTAGVGLAASVITAVITHLLTRAQERRKHEHDVAAKFAELESNERSATLIRATQYAHSCLIVELNDEITLSDRAELDLSVRSERDRVFLPIGSRITFGRSAENHIRIDDPLVSRIHATFRAQGASAYVEPLCATHGLAVNGNDIGEPTKLAAGDIITVPGASFKITFVPLVR